MGFLAPWFLGGLLAVGLPVWIHLLRRHKTTPLPFSSLMFFERRTQSSVKHRRLRYLLLLTLRLALLVLLALAFAKPYINRNVAAADIGRKMLLIVIDNSFSMRYGDHLNRAKQQALTALARFRDGDQAQLFTLDSQLRALTKETQDRAQLQSAIQTVQPGDGRSSYGELARALRNIGQSISLPLEVHLVSDMQKSSMPPAFSDLRLNDNSRLILHSVADPSERNWTIENVNAPRNIYNPKKVRVQATLAGYGTEPSRRNVSLAINNRVLETKPVDIPANGRATVEFFSMDAPYGFNRAEVRMDGGDALKEDDRFIFAVQRADPRRVLFLHQARDTRSVLYFQSALDAASDAAFTLEPVATDQAGHLALSKYAFVVLSDAATLPDGFEDALRSYIKGGGAALVAIGPATALRGKAPISSDLVLASRYFSRDGERFQTVANVDRAHPAVHKAGRLDDLKFYQATKLDAASARVIVRLTDQTPLLMERKLGEGKLLLYASTFDNISNDFPLHPSFVPFVEQTSHYLAGLEQKPANFAVNSHLELRSTKDQGTAVEVIDPSGHRAQTLNEAATAETFVAAQEGFYEVRRANGHHELVAVHSDRRESDLATIAPEMLALWQNTDPSGPSGPVNSTPSERQREKQSSNLWRYFVLLLLVVAVAESLVASRYLSLEKEPE